jgi:hypothetical protein
VVNFDQNLIADLADELDDLKRKVLFRVAMPSLNANRMETDLTFWGGSGQTLKIGKAGSIAGTNFEVKANGNITAKSISGTTGTFSGALKAASGDFGSGIIVTTGGLKAGAVTAAGQVKGASADFGSGTIKGGAISLYARCRL